MKVCGTALRRVRERVGLRDVASRGMPKAQRPTEQDAADATRIVLAGLARGEDVPELAKQLVALHPKNNTFPGEVFIGLGADVLDLIAPSRQNPIPYEAIRDRYLPECEFRGRDNRKLQYTLLCVAALRGGIELDLLDEVYWWQTDNFWYYALCAFAAWTRAAAEHAGTTVPVICQRVAAQHDCTLPA